MIRILKTLPLQLFLPLLLLGFSCGEKQQKGNLNPHQADNFYQQKVKLVKSGQKVLELDSLTTPVLFQVQVFEENGLEKVAYLNDELGAIYCNDLKSGKITRRILVSSGTTSFKKHLQGFLLHNKDSVFVFGKRPKVYLVGTADSVVKTYEVSDKKSSTDLGYGMVVRTGNPAFYLKNQLVLNSLLVGTFQKTEQRSVQVVFDLTSQKARLGSPTFPRLYNDHNWGGTNYLMYSNTFNPTTQTIVYSFPASHELQLNYLNGDSTVNRFAGSKYIKFIPEISDHQLGDNGLGKMAYFMENPSYGEIIYDKYRDVYYRMVLLPVVQKNIDYATRHSPIKPLSIIILDKNFKYLGETLLEKNEYWHDTFFVGREGLYIQNQMTNDETLEFTVFKTVPVTTNTAALH